MTCEDNLTTSFGPSSTVNPLFYPQDILYSFSVHESKSCLGVSFMDNVRMEHVCVLLVGMGDTAPLRRVPICAATMVNVGAISLETGDATVRMVGMGKIVPPS